MRGHHSEGGGAEKRRQMIVDRTHTLEFVRVPAVVASCASTLPSREWVARAGVGVCQSGFDWANDADRRDSQQTRRGDTRTRHEYHCVPSLFLLPFPSPSLTVVSSLVARECVGRRSVGEWPTGIA